jgi:hypothetical protein
MASAGPGNQLDVIAGFFCELFSFAKFPFGLEPKLFIPSSWPVVFVPDFPGALSDFFFVGFCQSAGSLFQVRCQGQYALNRFPIADPPREVAVLVGLLEKAGDRLLLIPCTLSIKLDDGALNLFNGLEGLKLMLRQELEGTSASFLRKACIGGNGPPSFRACMRTLLMLRWSAAAARMIDAPCATNS